MSTHKTYEGKMKVFSDAVGEAFLKEIQVKVTQTKREVEERQRLIHEAKLKRLE